MARRDRCSIRTPLLIQRDHRPPQVGVTLDLSHGGVGLVSPTPVEPGEILDLDLPLGEGTVHMVVEVVWSTPRGQGQRCGARLRAIGVRDSLLLKRELAQVAAEELRAAS